MSKPPHPTYCRKLNGVVVVFALLGRTAKRPNTIKPSLVIAR